MSPPRDQRVQAKSPLQKAPRTNPLRGFVQGRATGGRPHASATRPITLAYSYLFPPPTCSCRSPPPFHRSLPLRTRKFNCKFLCLLCCGTVSGDFSRHPFPAAPYRIRCGQKSLHHVLRDSPPYHQCPPLSIIQERHGKRSGAGSAVVPPRIVAWSIRTCVSLPLSAPPKWHLATNGPTRLLDKHLLFDRLGRGLVAAFHGIGTPSAFPKPVPPPVSFSGLILFRIFCSSRSCLFSSSHLWPKCDPIRAWPSNSRRSSALLSINPRRIRDSHQPTQTSTQHQGISS